MVSRRFRQQLWRETEADQATAGLRRHFLEKNRQQALNGESIWLSEKQRRNFQRKEVQKQKMWGPEPSWSRASRKRVWKEGGRSVGGSHFLLEPLRPSQRRKVGWWG